MPTGVRFWPPDSPVTAGVEWVLIRAFATPGHDLARVSTPSDCLVAAARLGILPRIFTRQPTGLLRSELAGEFESATLQLRSIVAHGLALERTLDNADRVCRSIGVKYALIKGAAVTRHLGITLGLRGACDIDVLLNPSDAVRLHEELKRRGYSNKTPSHPTFHLPALADDQGISIEIHTSLPHVSLCPGKHSTQLQDLLDQKEVTHVSSDNQCALLPTRDFLFAHCVVHGIAQHGYTPKSYPLLRMLADVADLMALTPPPVRERVETWVAGRVSREEVNAVLSLHEALVRGQGTEAWRRTDGTGRLLRHVVLGMLDTKYANGLAPYEAVHLLRTSGVRQFLEEYTRATFGLANEDISRIYGPGTRGREILLKLIRPFDVGVRIARMMPQAIATLARRLR